MSYSSRQWGFLDGRYYSHPIINATEEVTYLLTYLLTYCMVPWCPPLDPITEEVTENICSESDTKP